MSYADTVLFPLTKAYRVQIIIALEARLQELSFRDKDLNKAVIDTIKDALVSLKRLR